MIPSKRFVMVLFIHITLLQHLAGCTPFEKTEQPIGKDPLFQAPPPASPSPASPSPEILITITDERCLGLPQDPLAPALDSPSPLNSNGTPKRFGPSPATEKGQTVLLRYDDFGPQAAAHPLIGMDWPTWETGGNFAPDDKFDIRVVVYRGVSISKVATRFKTINNKMDHRIVSHKDALDHLDASLQDLQDFLKDAPDTTHLEALIQRLSTTRAIITHCLGQSTSPRMPKVS